jgi:radical SAM protein with 4Fe4S-binding SPASM domain
VRRQNAALAPGFYEWCLDHGVQAHVELPNCGADTRDSFLAFRPTRTQVRSLVASLQDIELRRGLGARPFFPPHLTGGPSPSPNGCCPFYGRSLYLRPNGDAQVCSGLREPLGNVHHDGVEFVVRRLWQATRPRAQSEMKGHCRLCELWNHCRGGCPTSALGAGDAMLPDPMCSRGEPW